MDHVGVVVDDLQAAVDFFVALGLEATDSWTVEGDSVDRIVGLQGVRSQVAFVQTPDGHNRLELCKFLSPPHDGGEQPASPHAPGIRHLTFAVDDVDATLARLRPHGAELVGEVENYEGIYRLCYLRGPAGIIVEIAERLG
jgi:catechol 2,3-dioxygenase-like lactoylglutathione lyase family enzyme